LIDPGQRHRSQDTVTLRPESGLEVTMSHTDTALSHPGLLGRVLGWVHEHASAGSDLTALSRQELQRIAEDLSLAETDLRSFADGARNNTLLMQRMMRCRGLDPDRARDVHPTLLRDIERVCTLCRSTGKCRRELDAGTAAEHFRDYCPNAATFDDLTNCEGRPASP
jgi:hypothetical protein